MMLDDVDDDDADAVRHCLSTTTLRTSAQKILQNVGNRIRESVTADTTTERRLAHSAGESGRNAGIVDTETSTYTCGDVLQGHERNERLPFT